VDFLSRVPTTVERFPAVQSRVRENERESGGRKPTFVCDDLYGIFPLKKLTPSMTNPLHIFVSVAPLSLFHSGFP
jgi:hypothetical protein